MKNRSIVLLMLFLTMELLLAFGKNKVQYHNFKWKNIETKNFVIFYYEGGEELAKFCGYNAENSLQFIKRDFLFDLDKKITIVVYNSHNHFQETNTLSGIPEESVGGFTEFFKNRVVIPYQGNWEDFRHVIHHELTHAVMNQIMFGSNFQSIVSGMAQTNLPLWFIEGLAEYQSRGGWDRESDQFIRDAIYNNYLPSVNQLHNYMAYKGGQNLLYYISETYGHKKIGDIIRKISVLRSTEGAFRDAIGLEFKELTEEWHRWLQSNYWPKLLNSDAPEKIATRLTKHEEDRNFVNSSPAISPDGKTIAYLSDKSDYFSIYLMRTFDGKVIKKIVAGQTSGHFEEMHWLRPGFGWSPDSKKIVFSAKSGKNDALYIYNALSGDQIEKIRLELDGLYSPAWSPKGEEIAFVGVVNGQSDLYSYNLTTKTLRQLTKDIFSETDPSYSLDGSSLIYSSDREKDGDWNLTNLHKKDHRPQNVFTLSLEDSAEPQQLTFGSDKQSSPFWLDKDNFAFISNKNGINNLYRQNINQNSPILLTNLITGLSQLSYSQNKLAFTTLFKGGYDIYLLDDVQGLEELPFFEPKLHYQEQKFNIPPTYEKQSSNLGSLVDVNKMIFDRATFREGKKSADSLDFQKQFFYYKPYEVSFSPDIIMLNAGYSSNFGFNGTTYMQFSDQLSNHQINSSINLSQDIVNSNFDIAYYYLPRRLNMGVGLSHNSVWYWIDKDDDDYYQLGEGFNDRLLSNYFTLEYPLNRFTRVDGFLAYKHIINSVLDVDDEPKYNSTYNLLNSGIGFSYDNTVWGIVGPENGFRMRVDFSYTPSSHIFGNKEQQEFQFQTLTGDFRNYWRIYHDFQIATRLSCGASTGSTPQNFMLGGISNWLGASVKSENIPEDLPGRYYNYSTSPLRGTPLLNQRGDRFALLNMELRYPFINVLSMGFPLPITIGYIRGVLFADVGSAWNGDNFRGVKSNEKGSYLHDLNYSSGFGARANLGYFILRYDVAWQWDWQNNASRPRHIFSLGANY